MTYAVSACGLPSGIFFTAAPVRAMCFEIRCKIISLFSRRCPAFIIKFYQMFHTKTMAKVQEKFGVHTMFLLKRSFQRLMFLSRPIREFVPCFSRRECFCIPDGSKGADCRYSCCGGTEKNKTLSTEISYNRSENADNKEKSFCI